MHFKYILAVALVFAFVIYSEVEASPQPKPFKLKWEHVDKALGALDTLRGLIPTLKTVLG